MEKKYASTTHRLLLLANLATNGNESAKHAMREVMDNNSAYKAALCLMATSKTLEYAADKLIDYKDENTMKDGSNAEIDTKLSGWVDKLLAVCRELTDFVEPDKTSNSNPLDMDWFVNE